MFQVIKTTRSTRPEPVDAREYVEKHKIMTAYTMRNRIREYRQSLGLTQSQVAEMIHITRQTFSLIETEKQEPSLLTAWLISRVLNADMAELFFIEETEK